MNKNVKLAISGGLALFIVVGGFLLMRKFQQDGGQCQFCGKPLKHSELLGHENTCPKNDSDRRPQSGSEGK